MKNNKYTNYSKEELIAELDALKKKKYGLVWDKKHSQEVLDAVVNWENMPENFVPNKFPVLKQVKNKDITTDKNGHYNLLLEGDNYHSLAVLNFTHPESVDVIYIDPPYNTGNKDFIFNDRFIDSEDPYRHSKWLSFMEKRLRLSRGLLKDDGIIFISINDTEQAQLKMLCNEIFDEKNFLANLIWQNKEGGGSSDSKHFRIKHEYILVYAKDKNLCAIAGDDISNLDRYKQEDKYKKTRGSYYLQKLGMGTIQYSDSLDYPITTPDGKKVMPKDNNKGKRACWRWSKNKLKWGLENDFIVFKKDKEGTWQVYTKQYLNCDNEGNLIDRLQRPFGVIDNFSSTQASKELREIDITGFSYPKPKNLISYLISKNLNKSSLVLDFMAGSGTTGHAVIELNKKDGGNRQFILCTNNVELDNNGDKIKHKICTDICHPRIKKVINGYKDTTGKQVEGMGGNLKYFKTDFVGSQPTDKNKKDLVDKSTEMICIKENAFELIKDNSSDFKIFKNSNTYLGIIFNLETIDDFKKEAKKIEGKFNVYVFSLDSGVHGKEFADMKGKVVLQPIPEVILKVYRNIFK